MASVTRQRRRMRNPNVMGSASQRPLVVIHLQGQGFVTGDLTTAPTLANNPSIPLKGHLKAFQSGTKAKVTIRLLNPHANGTKPDSYIEPSDQLLDEPDPPSDVLTVTIDNTLPEDQPDPIPVDLVDENPCEPGNE